VWWDPLVLPASIQGRTSTRLTDFLKEDEARVQSEKGIRAHEEWQAQRATTRVAGATTAVSVLTATEYAEATLQAEAPRETQLPIPEVVVESIEIDSSRPQGKRFGVLVHATMALVPLNANRRAISEVAQLQGRILGATEDELAAAIETVDRALHHPVMQWAAAAAANGQCRREVPVAVKLDGECVVEGIVDLAFREQESGGRWTVVDYKTDFEIAGRLEEYQRQVGIYSLAISRATGQDARAVLLRI
jgi:ATP-dependent exoDNAse (exonuclease V) beta subunit